MAQTSSIFQNEKIRPELQAGLEKINFKKPTKVQSSVIPALLNKKNVVVQAATGSGKTHAYLIPILNMIDENATVTQAIVTAPSRELANQLYKVARQDKMVADFDGIPLMVHLNSQNKLSSKKKLGFSKAAQHHKVNTFRSQVQDKADSLTSLAVLDIETTGLNLEKDKIISIGAIKYLENNDCEKFYRLIKVDTEVPVNIEKITQLNKGVLANKGIDIKTALLDLRKFLADRIVVGYNLPFDINFLNRDFKKYCHYSLLNECVDLLSAVKKKNVFLDNYHLSTVLENYNIKNSNPHNSLADAVATMELLKKLIKNDNYKIK